MPICALCGHKGFKGFSDYYKHHVSFHSVKPLESHFKALVCHPTPDSKQSIHPFNSTGRTKQQIVHDVEAYYKQTWEAAGLDNPIIGGVE
jgi:hypothetical protein